MQNLVAGTGAECKPLARISHDGASSPTLTLTLPHNMGEGEGAFLVKRINLKIVVSAEF